MRKKERLGRLGLLKPAETPELKAAVSAIGHADSKEQIAEILNGYTVKFLKNLANYESLWSITNLRKAELIDAFATSKAKFFRCIDRRHIMSHTPAEEIYLMRTQGITPDYVWDHHNWDKENPDRSDPARPICTYRLPNSPETAQPASAPDYSDSPADIDEAYSDAPGDNSHPAHDIPDDHVPDYATASDDWRKANAEARSKMARFVHGQVYYSNAGLPYTVIKRSKKFITLTDKNGNTIRKQFFDWVSHGLNTGRVPEAEFVILNSNKGHKLHADSVPCPLVTIVPHQDIPMPKATDTIKLLDWSQYLTISNRIEYNKGESFLGSFTFNYFDNGKKSALFIVTQLNNGQGYSFHGDKIFTLYEDFSFSHSSTVAVYSPRSETFQVTNNYYNWEKTGNFRSLEEQFRRVLPQFLTAAGILDNKGYIIPDGYEHKRVNDTIADIRAKISHYADRFDPLGLIIPGLAETKSDEADSSIRDYPLSWPDSTIKLQAIHIYLRLLNAIYSYNASYCCKHKASPKLALSLIAELYRLFDAQKTSVVDTPEIISQDETSCNHEITANLAAIVPYSQASGLRFWLRFIAVIFRLWLASNITPSGFVFNSDEYLAPQTLPLTRRKTRKRIPFEVGKTYSAKWNGYGDKTRHFTVLDRFKETRDNGHVHTVLRVYLWGNNLPGDNFPHTTARMNVYDNKKSDHAIVEECGLSSYYIFRADNPDTDNSNVESPAFFAPFVLADHDKRKLILETLDWFALTALAIQEHFSPVDSARFVKHAFVCDFLTLIENRFGLIDTGDNVCNENGDILRTPLLQCRREFYGFPDDDTDVHPQSAHEDTPQHARENTHAPAPSSSPRHVDIPPSTATAQFLSASSPLILSVAWRRTLVWLFCIIWVFCMRKSDSIDREKAADFHRPLGSHELRLSETRGLKGEALREATCSNASATIHAPNRETLASELATLSTGAIKRIGKCLGLLTPGENGSSQSLAEAVADRLFEHLTPTSCNQPRTYTDRKRQICIIFE